MNSGNAIVIDGNAIVWRSWHATQKSSSSLESPEKTIASIKNTIKSCFKKNYEYGVVVFDSTKDTFRKEFFSDYKANRVDSMPQELFNALPEIHKVIKEMGFNILSAPKPYEGDDVIATLSKIFTDHKIKTDIFSTDKDMLQLVSYYTSVTLLKKSERKEHTFRNFQQDNEGLMPWQIPIFKSLAGDSSDNYKGIPGIGKSAAYKILKTHPSAEDIYNDLDSLDLRAKQKEELIRQKENLFLFIEKLASVKNDIEEISTNIDNYIMKTNESNSGSRKSGK